MSVKVIARAKGQSAVASSAYRARTRMTDERTDFLYDYRHARQTQALIALECFAPDGTPLDRGKLWNAAELADTRKNSNTAREVEIALPDELDRKEQVALAVEYAKGLAERHFCAVDVAVHGPDIRHDKRNFHAHILFTSREVLDVDEDGRPVFGGKNRDFCLDDKKERGKNGVDEEREEWEKACNRALKKLGLEERVDHRSYAERGLDLISGGHVGPNIGAMRERGIETGQWVDAIERKAQRKRLEALILSREDIDREISEIERRLEKEERTQALPERSQRLKTREVRKPFTEKTLAPSMADLKRAEEDRRQAEELAKREKREEWAQALPVLDAAMVMAVTGYPDRCRFYDTGNGLNIMPLYEAGLEPAAVLATEVGLVVGFKMEQYLTPERVEALDKAVKEVYPEAKSVEIPEEGTVIQLIDRSVSKPLEIGLDRDIGR